MRAQMLECDLAPRRCRVLPVAMDRDGMLPHQLEQASFLNGLAEFCEQKLSEQMCFGSREFET